MSSLMRKKVISRSLIVIILLSFSSFLFACRRDEAVGETESYSSGTAPHGEIVNPTATYYFATSSPGYARIEGMLVVQDPLILLPKPDGVHLLPVGENIQSLGDIAKLPLDGAYQADVDERDGRFVFPDVKVGRYAIVVNTINNLNIPAHFTTSGELAFIEVTNPDVDKVVSIGLIRIP